MSVPLTDFQARVLLRISKRLPVSGNKMASYSAGARNLEKRGLCQKTTNWHLTEEGRKLLNNYLEDQEEIGKP